MLLAVEITIQFTLALSFICSTSAVFVLLAFSAEILRISLSDMLRMTGFAGRASGHDQHLLKTPNAKIAE
jgi:hypothetical protein